MVRRIRFCLLIGVSFLLLAACGGNTTSTASASNAGNDTVSPGPEFSASPSVEGTGPQSAPPAANGGGGGGGIAVSLAGLPIGKNAQYGRNDHCVEIIWKGAPPADGHVVTVSLVKVLSGPFKAYDGVPADCPHGPACVGYRVTAANIGDGRCYTDLEYTGDPVDPVANADGLEVNGSLELLGGLSCPGASRAACDRELDSLHNSGVSEIEFTDTIVPSGSADAGSPSQGDTGSPPESTGSPTDTGSPTGVSGSP
jgi:hypothetical protein